MLPGNPSCPYGILSGSISTVFPSLTNVTLYFFVAGANFVSSIYGFLPPMLCCSSLNALITHSERSSAQLQQMSSRTKPATRSLKRLHVVQVFAFERGLQRAVHQHFGQMRRGRVYFVNPGAHQLVIAARQCRAQLRFRFRNGFSLRG